jgi:hydroxyacylglutathione hydrolase
MNSTIELLALPAFEDNYLWLLHNGQHAAVVDPGDAQVILNALSQHQLQLTTILVTHHHADHIGGVEHLQQLTGAAVFGPGAERIVGPATASHIVREGDSVTALNFDFRVLETPGHTAGHIAYYASFVTTQHGQRPLLFCGDTLFSAGCGRLFEGSPGQMYASLKKLAVLPTDTLVCCAHEYTLNNLKFALMIEPDNPNIPTYQAWCEAQRQQQLPTLPSTVGQELLVNPFLRTQQHTVLQSAQARAQLVLHDDVAVLATLREWKNEFR